jgi:hydrogenase maturation protease
MTCVLVIGVGHPDRGDDAVGWLVAERLRARLIDLVARDPEELPAQAARPAAPVVIERTSGDPSALLTLAAWDDADHIVLIDAMVTGAVPGTVDIRGRDDPLPTPGASGTHDLGVATTLELARALDRMPPDLTLVGIEGSRFSLGDLPSAPVLAAAERVAAGLEGEVRRLVSVCPAAPDDVEGRAVDVPG